MQTVRRLVKIFILIMLTWFVADSMQSLPSHSGSGELLQIPGSLSGNLKLNNDPEGRYLSGWVDPAVEKLMRQWELPGASFALSLHEHIIYAKGFGLADKDAGKPVTADAKFRVASVSKLITATAILKLVEMGRLSLDRFGFLTSRGKATGPDRNTVIITPA